MTARPTFDDAVSRLNGRGLIPALSLCSGLSLYELGSGPGTVAFPMLNQEKVRVLGDAVLRSNAAEYKTGVVSDEDLAYILNGCHKALDDERLRREVPDGAERLLMLVMYAKTEQADLTPRQVAILRRLIEEEYP